MLECWGRGRREMFGEWVSDDGWLVPDKEVGGMGCYM